MIQPGWDTKGSFSVFFFFLFEIPKDNSQQLDCMALHFDLALNGNEEDPTRPCLLSVIREEKRKERKRKREIIKYLAQVHPSWNWVQYVLR